MREELLPKEKVRVPLLQEGGAAWPEPSAEQLNTLGAYLLLKAEETEADPAAAAGGSSRSRSKGKLVRMGKPCASRGNRCPLPLAGMWHCSNHGNMARRSRADASPRPDRHGPG